jgi:protein TonB
LLVANTAGRIGIETLAKRLALMANRIMTLRSNTNSNQDLSMISGTHSRIVSAAAIVAVVHVALIATVARMNGQPPLPQALESPVITAQLLSQETSADPLVQQPAHSASPAPMPVAHPIARANTHPAVAHARPATAPAPQPAASPPPAPSPSEASANPTPDAASPRESTDASSSKPGQEAQRQAPATASLNGQETLAVSAPKNVSHLDCRIRKPDYPSLSRRRGETGTANVRFVVSPTGTIERVELAKSSGFSRLDEAALAAMRESSCQPYVENGAPIRVTYTQPFGFALED